MTILHVKKLSKLEVTKQYQIKIANTKTGNKYVSKEKAIICLTCFLLRMV